MPKSCRSGQAANLTTTQLDALMVELGNNNGFPEKAGTTKTGLETVNGKTRLPYSRFLRNVHE